MAKFLEVNFPDGYWHIPAHIIADDRAKYYAQKDTGWTQGPEYDATYREEYDFTMGDEYELCDWAANNMNWEDVKAHAVHVRPLAIDYENEWVKARKNLVEK